MPPHDPVKQQLPAQRAFTLSEIRPPEAKNLGNFFSPLRSSGPPRRAKPGAIPSLRPPQDLLCPPRERRI